MRPGKIPKWLSGLVHPVSSYILCRNISDLNHLIIMHNICWRENLLSKDTRWEVFVFGVFLVRIFPAFGLNTERYSVYSEYREMHFSSSDSNFSINYLWFFFLWKTLTVALGLLMKWVTSVHVLFISNTL